MKRSSWFWMLLFSAGFATPGFGAVTLDPARIDAIAAMLPPQATGLGPQITNRPEWAIASRLTSATEVIKAAEKLLVAPLPPTTDDLFLEYSRNGNRTHWQDLNNGRRSRVTTLVLAECLENHGRFLPALNAVLESIVAEPTWVMPAHDGSLANFHGQRIDIDLGSSGLGWSLATADWMIGEKLDPATRHKLREAIAQRILTPFKDMVTGKRPLNGWLTQTNNWNAVCLAGVIGAALAELDDPKERALYIAAAEVYSSYFLKSFTPDGYCSEGVGYWNYGFGHFLLLAETIARATAGRVDLLAGEAVQQAAWYGLRIEIVPGVCPAFADCDVNAVPDDRWINLIRKKWGLPSMGERRARPELATHSLMETGLFTFNKPVARNVPASAPAPAERERTWFPDAGVLICRPTNPACRLSAALKGGHNAENHNHNDVGSYVVVAGKQLVLVDPGSEVYTARTFSSHRYDSKVLNSFGHPVPIVAGQLQKTGAQARGKILNTEFAEQTDQLSMDITSAYAVADLTSLKRSFVYERAGEGSLTVTDEVSFSKPESFATALITFGTWKQAAPDRLHISDGREAVDVVITAAGGKIAVTAEEIHEDTTAKRTPVHIGIAFEEPVKEGKISLTITPAKP